MYCSCAKATAERTRQAMHVNEIVGRVPVTTVSWKRNNEFLCTRVGTSIVATIYLQLIQNRYMFRSFTLLHCSHQHCVQPVASDVEVVGYL